jgi:hypothetical protein
MIAAAVTSAHWSARGADLDAHPVIGAIESIWRCCGDSVEMVWRLAVNFRIGIRSDLEIATIACLGMY